MPADAVNKTKLLIDQVKKEKDVTEAINLLADIMLESQEASLKSMEKVEAEIKKMSDVLLGNGHPELALCTRMAHLEKRINWLFGLFSTIIVPVVIYFIMELIKLV